MSTEFFSFLTPSYKGVSLAGQPLACALRVGRARLDISQYEVARLAQVSRFRLHQAERGLITLRREELENLAEVLELPQLGTLAEMADAG